MPRRANRNDEPGILEMVKRVLAGYGLSVNPAVTDLDISDLERHYFNNGGYFAVIDDGGIIGSYGIYRLGADTCELRKMYLLPEFHGRGIGKIMMEDAIKRAVSLGYSEMFLETNLRLDRAIRLYERFGFLEYRPAHFSDRCDFAMRRRL